MERFESQWVRVAVDAEGSSARLLIEYTVDRTNLLDANPVGSRIASLGRLKIESRRDAQSETVTETQ